MDIEERIIELVKAMPHNEIVIDYEGNKWTYKYGKIFTFVVEKTGFGGRSYILNGVDLPSAFGYVISHILDDKATQKSKEDYNKTLEKIAKELQQ